MPNPKTLILIPTQLERTQLDNSAHLEGTCATVALCGFGVVAAAARTAQLIAAHAPDRVLLLGIAGTFDEASLAVGEACCFGSVVIDGIGRGQEADHVGAEDLGFEQWPAQGIGDRIELSVPGKVAASELLMTVCTASATPEEAAARRKRFSQAIAEDMEGFAVALACALTDTPLAIVRGISNRVGDLDKQNWRIREALQAAGELAAHIAHSDEPWEWPWERPHQ
jgi:futalosine hydrolase